MTSILALSSRQVPAAVQAEQTPPQLQQSSICIPQSSTLQSTGLMTQAVGKGEHPLPPEVKVVVDEYLQQEKIGSEMLEREKAIKAVEDMLALEKEEKEKKIAEETKNAAPPPSADVLRWQAGQLPEPGTAPATILLILYWDYQKPDGLQYMTRKDITNRAHQDLHVDLSTWTSGSTRSKMSCLVDLEEMEWITRVEDWASHPADRKKYRIAEAGAAVAQKVEQHRLQNPHGWPQPPRIPPPPPPQQRPAGPAFGWEPVPVPQASEHTIFSLFSRLVGR